jgi:hypothetical protein
MQTYKERNHKIRILKPFITTQGHAVEAGLVLNAKVRSYQTKSGMEVCDLLVLCQEGGAFMFTAQCISWDNLEFVE